MYIVALLFLVITANASQTTLQSAASTELRLRDCGQDSHLPLQLTCSGRLKNALLHTLTSQMQEWKLSIIYNTYKTRKGNSAGISFYEYLHCLIINLVMQVY